MKKTILLTLIICTICSVLPGRDEWIRYPAISPDGSQIAFTYKGDIHLVAATGGRARPLTFHQAHDFSPVWSRDGRWIAFASDRHGNFDVFIVGVDGGEPLRLTFHSSDEIPYCFSADGKQVLFSGSRGDSADHRQYHGAVFPELYAVPVEAGRIEQLQTLPMEAVQLNRDGTKMLYHDIKGGENPWRKHHRSAIARDIWSLDTVSGRHEKITTFSGEDRQPCFTPDESGMYYLSEQGGSFNVFRLDFAEPHKTRSLTEFKLHPVRFLSVSDNGKLCYTWNGELYTQLEGQAPKKVELSIISPTKTNDEKLVSANGRITEMAVSPDGKEVAFIVRGEVIAASTEGKWTKRITRTPAAEAFISFSPDGKYLIYASERNGRWGIYRTRRVLDREPYFFAATLLKEEPLLVNDHDNYQPKLSPDGKKLAYIQDRSSLRVLDLPGKESRTLLDEDHLFYMRDGDQYFDWSPDGKWLLVQYRPVLDNSEILLVAADGGREPLNLSESGYGDLRPKWVNEGRQIIWFSDRHGLRSYANSGNRQVDVYSMFMTRAGLDRFLLSKDEFALQKMLEEKDKAKAPEKDKKKDSDLKTAPAAPLVIDWIGLQERKKRLTIHSAHISDAVLSKDGETLYYLGRFDDRGDLWSTELRTRETKPAVKLGVSGGSLYWDGEMKNLYLLAEGRIQKLDPVKGSKEAVFINAELSVDENAERREMFEHVWNRTNAMFYTSTFHGIDWTAMYQNYSPKVNSVGNDFEFVELLSEMLGELNVSHCGARLVRRDEQADKTASLGIIVDHQYRGPGLKIAELLVNGPLDRADLGIGAGMIIEEINGMPFAADEDWAKPLNRLEGLWTAVLIKDPQKGSAKTVTVKPVSLSEENLLLYERWVRRNEEEVKKLGSGRLGYVHIPGMSDGPYRHVYEKAMGKYLAAEGLVVDTRNNGGGDLVGDITMFLSGKQFITYATERRVLGYEPNFRWTRPNVALVNESNYSDGHCFASAYQDLGLGKLIGMPVPGTCSFAGWSMLQNGTVLWGSVPVSARNLAGEWLENNQTEPDLVVKNMPGEVDRGRDEQLERAVAALLDILGEKNNGLE